MSVKDKIIFGIMIILIAGGSYIQYSYSKIMDRMDVLDTEQLAHVDEVNNDFREDFSTFSVCCPFFMLDTRPLRMSGHHFLSFLFNLWPI